MSNAHIGSGITFDGRWVTRDLPNGDQVRARVVPDEFGCDFEPERDSGTWGAGVMLVTDCADRGSVEHDECTELSALLERIVSTRSGRTVVYADPYSEAVTRDGVAHCDRETFVRRYMAAFHPEFQHVSLRKHRGYSQGDWADIWVVVDADDMTADDGAADALADAYWTEWDAWAKGDVYYVESQTRTLLDAMNGEDGDDGWSNFDSTYGYLGDERAQDGLVEALYSPGVGYPDRQDMPEPWQFANAY